MPLLYHSTNGQSPAVDLRTAMLDGQAPDRGLYLPEHFPRLKPEEITAFAAMPYHEIAFRVFCPVTPPASSPTPVWRPCAAKRMTSASRWKKFTTASFLMRLDQGADRFLQGFCRADDGPDVRLFSRANRPATHHPYGHQRGHRSRRGACLSQSPGRARNRPLSGCGSQRQPAPN